ncbi:MAG: hypothetical protein FJX72_08970 [Armatimonadetes bacterium]|nr:hypothetical protein [Armatimonadota bacterium]
MSVDSVQYVVDAAHRPTAVLVPLAEWERVVEQLEELADIRAYDAAKLGPQDAVPFEQAVSELRLGSGPCLTP